MPHVPHALLIYVCLVPTHLFASYLSLRPTLLSSCILALVSFLLFSNQVSIYDEILVRSLKKIQYFSLCLPDLKK